MSRNKSRDLIPMPNFIGAPMMEIGERIARKEEAWRARLGICDGIVIPERSISDDDEEFLDEHRTALQEMSVLLKIRTSPQCPSGQEGAALDDWYIRVLNWRFRLQVALQNRSKGR